MLSDKQRRLFFLQQNELSNLSICHHTLTPKWLWKENTSGNPATKTLRWLSLDCVNIFLFQKKSKHTNFVDNFYNLTIHDVTTGDVLVNFSHAVFQMPDVTKMRHGWFALFVVSSVSVFLKKKSLFISSHPIKTPGSVLKIGNFLRNEWAGTCNKVHNWTCKEKTSKMDNVTVGCLVSVSMNVTFQKQPNWKKNCSSDHL